MAPRARGIRPRKSPAAASGELLFTKAPKLLFWMLATFLVLEYIRPVGIVQLKLQMLIVILLPVLCLVRMKKRPWSMNLTIQLLLLVLNVVHIPFAINNYGAYVTTRILVGTVAIAIGMAWVYSNLESFRRGLWVWTLVMVYLGVYGITHDGKGPGGFIGDENDLALACNTAIPLAFFGFQLRRGWQRWAYAGIAVVLTSALVATFSRGGAVGLAALGVYCLSISKHKLRNFVLVIVAGIALIGLAPQEYRDELLSIKADATGEVKGTGTSRRFLWTSAFNMWTAHPVFGVGAGCVGYSIGDHQPTDWESYYTDRNWSGTTVHSFYFELLAEQGATGLILVAVMVGNHFMMMSRLRKRARSRANIPSALRVDIEMYTGALSGAMVGFLASGTFLSVTYYPYLWYFTALSVAFDAAIKNELHRLETARVAMKRRSVSVGVDSAAEAPELRPASLGARLRRSHPHEP